MKPYDWLAAASGAGLAALAVSFASPAGAAAILSFFFVISVVFLSRQVEGLVERLNQLWAKLDRIERTLNSVDDIQVRAISYPITQEIKALRADLQARSGQEGGI